MALSRVRRLSGLHIIGLNEKTFQVHPDVLLKDKIFRDESLEVQNAFSKISLEEISTMHDNFIFASGGIPRGKILNKKKSVGFEEIRKKYPNAYRSWSKDEDDKLRILFAKNISARDIAKEFGRKTGAIHSRLEKLGLEEKRN